MNSYTVEIETETGAVKRAVVSADTRGGAYRFVTSRYPSADVLSIVLVK